jgi:hypothetical protein
MDAVHADSLRRHLGRHVPGQGLETELRRRVVRASGQHLRRLNRPDVDDRRLALFANHAPAQHLRAEPRTAKVDVDETRPLLVGQLEEGNDRLDTGVVDQDVDRSELLPDTVDHRFDVGAPRHVGLHGRRPASRRSDRCGDLLRLVHVRDIVDRDVRSLGGEHLRNPAPDAPRRARHQCHFALQSQRTPPRPSSGSDCSESENLYASLTLNVRE